MARPSMANKTSSSRAIRTMAWPSCSRRCGDLIAVLGAINRISSDDDPVSDNLLHQWSDWLEAEPESHLDRLVAHCGLDSQTDGAPCRRRAQASAGAGCA